MGMTYFELLDLPEDVYVQATQMFAEEAERQREYQQHLKSKSKKPFQSNVDFSPKPSAPPETEGPREETWVDPKTGYEMVKTVRKDGTVVNHRKVEPGEMELWRIIGGVPPSFRGKVDI